MSEYFEIAYAAVSKRLCFLTGTGFSKAVTNGNAPSWQGLLEDVCDLLPNSSDIKDALFSNEKKQLSLDEAAQILSIELNKQNKCIKKEIKNIIVNLSLAGDYDEIKRFISKHDFRVITTNYDKLMEILVGENKCQSITPGLPIPRSKTNVNVYHVHGSIDFPENMVITSNDYYNFINEESYFSRKLSTIIHEDTIVILGYSLGDTNLKAIINDCRKYSHNQIISSNIFLISRSKVNNFVKDYYAACYGIRVIDNIELNNFFRLLNHSMDEAKECLDESVISIREVVYEGRQFSKEFIETENSFFKILCSISAIGLSINEPKIVEILGDVIKVKTDLTKEDGKWEQYTHLANWLIYLARILELKGTSIEKIYLEAVLRSMKTMSKELHIGYSWEAFRSWYNGWFYIISSNRSLIRNYMDEIGYHGFDALEVTSQG